MNKIEDCLYESAFFFFLNKPATSDFIHSFFIAYICKEGVKQKADAPALAWIRIANMVHLTKKWG